MQSYSHATAASSKQPPTMDPGASSSTARDLGYSAPKPRWLPTSKSTSFVTHQHTLPPSTTLLGTEVADSRSRRRAFESSATWTSSNGDVGFLSDTDEIEGREQFVMEYNRLAKKV